MYKHKLLPVIAAIMITSMAVSLLSFSATTVSASPDTASISPTTVGSDRWVVLTIRVTNGTGSSIAKILIRDLSDNLWDNPIGGHQSTRPIKENWDNMAENLGAAGTRLSQVSENLREALTCINAAGVALESAADKLKDAGIKLGDSNLENVPRIGENLRRASENLKAAGTALKTEPENLGLVGAQLRAAEVFIASAGAVPVATGTGQERGRDNLAKISNEDCLDNAAQYMENGNFHLPGDNLYLAGTYFINAGTEFAGLAGSAGVAGEILRDSVGPLVRQAAENLRRAGENLEEAGTALATVRNFYFENAKNLPMDNKLTQLTYLGAEFSDNINAAATALSTDDKENILSAGENMKLAGLALSAVQDAAVVEFGSRYLGTRSDSVDNYLVKAGDNLRDRERLNITTAASAIDNAASQLTQAKSVLKATAAKLAPNNWALTEAPADKGDVTLTAESWEYQLADGDARDFVFLWRAPTTGKTYTLKLWYYDNTGGLVGTADTVSITVDTTKPEVVTLKVTQTGAAVDNVVGTVRDDGKAKITLVASEACSIESDTYIENTDGDNKLPPIPPSAWTTTDNINFEYLFPVGAWDENTMRVQIRASWAKDAYGNENTSAATVVFIVDTRKPVFIDNGLNDELELLPFVMQTGTGKSYRTDNDPAQVINGIVQDNATAARFGYDNNNITVIPSITITWDTRSDAADLLPEENFYKKVTLSEGLNSVVMITATDWAGNSENVKIDNIFIDTRQPTIAFNTIAGAAWTENGKFVKDNKPTIKVTITDPDYPTKGLGVYSRFGAADNLDVYLDNDDNINNGSIAELENKAAWDPSTGIFENTYDNAGKGLATGTYWIIVRANDNLRHAAAENENWAIAKQSFIIDVTAPAWTETTISGIGTLYDPDNPTATGVLPHTTKKDTWLIKGRSIEPGSTVKVYVGDVLKETKTTPTTPDPVTGEYSYSMTITLSEGKNQKIYFEEIDRAGNTSGKVLYGTYTVDKTPPVITLSAPADGATTDAAQITVTGKVVDAIATYDMTYVWIDCTGALVHKSVMLKADGSFSTTIPLVEGTNVINVYAMDGAIDALAGNQSITTVTVTRTVAPLTTYAIIIVIVALILAAIAIFVKK